MDWNAIKTEYITDGSMSYRKLAKKYGVTLQAICDRSKKEHWIEQRERFADKTLTATVEAVGEAQVNRAKRLMALADRLVDKIESCVNNFEMQDLFADKQILRQITGAIKDIKDIQGIKSEADIREQEARIAKYQKEAQEDSGDTEIEVTFGEEGRKWAE